MKWIEASAEEIFLWVDDMQVVGTITLCRYPNISVYVCPDGTQWLDLMVAKQHVEYS